MQPNSVTGNLGGFLVVCQRHLDNLPPCISNDLFSHVMNSLQTMKPKFVTITRCKILWATQGRSEISAPQYSTRNYASNSSTYNIFPKIFFNFWSDIYSTRKVWDPRDSWGMWEQWISAKYMAMSGSPAGMFASLYKSQDIEFYNWLHGFLSKERHYFNQGSYFSLSSQLYCLWITGS